MDSVIIKEEHNILETKEEIIEQEFEQLCVKSENVNDDDSDKPEEDIHHNNEQYLITNPDTLKELCGLSDIQVFEALLTYIQVDMPLVKGASKYEQLVAVLAKLHTDEDTAILSPYLFPTAYITTVELMYDKLSTLCKNSTYSSPLPSVFMPEFDSTQRVIIVGFLLISIRSTFEEFPENLHTVKYLIAYSPFGEVTFVSNAFVGSDSNFSLILSCGLLQKVKADDWILFNENSFTYISQVKQVSIKNKYKSQLNSAPIAEHMFKVVSRLKEHFKVLQSFIPDFMLQHHNGVCFLDKLVFVCCMLLNMLPRIVYS